MQTKPCWICDIDFPRPEGMCEYDWQRRQTCGDPACLSERKSQTGKLGGVRASSRMKVTQVWNAPHDVEFIPLTSEYGRREPLVAWMFN